MLAIPEAVGGSLVLSDDGARGVLYTNASLDEHVTIVELAEPGLPYQTFPLQKSVRAVGFDPTGNKLIVLHARAPGDPGQAPNFEEFINRSHGYSTVDIASGFSKLQITDVNPEAFAFAPDAPRAYVTLDGGPADGAVLALEAVAGWSDWMKTLPATESLSVTGAVEVGARRE